MPATISTTVSAWYRRAARTLPWRESGVSPWSVLVSEVMLQQTPVARVLPAYDAWLARWPTPTALAGDSPGEAVRMWGKLGYPRRALRLHACAVALVDRFGGEVPADVDALETLPGIGAYTARAVAVFAFGQRHPVVDTNVRRVVARAVDARAQPGPPSTRRDHAAVSALLPRDPTRAAVASIALMELGALVCTARNPDCPGCPLARTHQCAWLGAGRPDNAGTRPRPQRFSGTDRQVRGRLMDVLRTADGPVTATDLDIDWPNHAQRARALASLQADGLVVAHSNGTFSLPT